MTTKALAALGLFLATTTPAPAVDDILPRGAHPPALPADHFPSPLHAVVWRNWNLVPAERLAETLSGSVEDLETIAHSLGLPASRPVPASFDQSLYITVLRRNWHLLPYDQILVLLDRTPEELAFSLKEDDFLFHKLGNLKPQCEPVRLREPTGAERQRAAEIRQLVQEEFPGVFEGGEPPLAFIEELSRPLADAPGPSASPKKDNAAGGLRYLHSYFGVFGDPLLDPELDPFPEGLLQRLAAQGVNGVWFHVVLHQLAPENGPFPEFGKGSPQRLARLRGLVGRAAAHGIRIYLYMNEPRAMPSAFFENRPEIAGGEHRGHVALCTSAEPVRAWLRDSLAHVFAEVPGLGGVFTITASENFTNCVSKSGETDCPRCSQRPYADIIAEVNRTIAEGVHAAAPEAKVIVWDWGWNRHGDGTDIIRQLPRDVWFQSVSEWAQPFARGDYRGKVGEYSISVVGPGPRAKSHWATARERGLPTVAKVQFNNTWEFSAAPWLPVMDLVAEHAANLAAEGVEHTMLSWSLGGYPSPNLEIAQAFARDPGASAERVLDALAASRYGPEAAPDVRKAWTAFSEAFREFPYGSSLYTAPQQFGPANLLHPEPSGYVSTMIGFPYDDLDRWRGGHTRENYLAQLEKLVEGWNRGLTRWTDVLEKVAPEKTALAAADGALAETVSLHFASVIQQSRFVIARDRVLEENGTWIAAPEIRAILEKETTIAKRQAELAKADSRIGYEASNHYYYRPRDLVEKVIQCRWLGR